MAYNFNGASQQISGDPSADLESKSAATIAGWVRRATTGTTQRFGFTGSNYENMFQLAVQTNNKLEGAVGYGGAAAGGSAGALGTGWFHCALVFDGSLTGAANRLKVYLDGSLLTLSFFNSSVPATTFTNIGIWRFGRDETPNNAWSTGDMCEGAAWDAALTADEVVSLAKGFKPRRVRPQSLKFYAPIIRETIDVRKAVALTNASATVANHARVI